MKGEPRSIFSVRGVFSVRNLAIMGVLLALSVVLSGFEIRVSDQFKLVTFTFLPGALASILFGPIAGLVFGLASDTVTYFARPMGAYFPGYALSAMVANLIYALWLYRRPIAIWRVIVSRVMIVLIVTLGLNGLWMILMYGQSAGAFYSTARIVRNLIQFPFDVALIVFFAKLSRRLLDSLPRKDN